MLNTIRLPIFALFMGLFLVACGDDTPTQQDAAETATTEQVADVTVDTAETAAADAAGDTGGMTVEAAISQWGQPDFEQTRQLDELTILHYEWHKDDGITSVQFHNGVEAFRQFIPAE